MYLAKVIGTNWGAKQATGLPKQMTAGLHESSSCPTYPQHAVQLRVSGLQVAVAARLVGAPQHDGGG